MIADNLLMVATIRPATFDDTDDLVRLNHRWFKANVANPRNGFLSVTYEHDFFNAIIANEDLLVFMNDDVIAGYVLVNTVHITERINSIKAEYFHNRPLNQTKRIAFNYQIVMDKVLHGTGYFYQAQHEYFDYFRKKYDILVSTVSKENPRSINAHTRAGWTFIDTPNAYFLIEQHL